MTIYEIDQSIMELVDPETGELLDFEAFAELRMEREKKIEAMALWVKDLTATAAAIAEEIKVLQDRKRHAEAKAQRLKEYLDRALDGQKFTTPRCSVSYRSSSKVQVDPYFVAWALENERDDLLRVKPAEPDLRAVKAALDAGEEIPGAEIVKTRSLGVK